MTAQDIITNNLPTTNAFITDYTHLLIYINANVEISNFHSSRPPPLVAAFILNIIAVAAIIIVTAQMCRIGFLEQPN